MKKLIALLSVLVVSVGIVFAQNDSTRSPKAYNALFEVDLNPSSDEGSISISKLQLKFMLSDRIAVRLGGMLNNKHNELSETDHDDEYEEISKTWSIFTGADYHFIRASKVSPYIGIEAGFSKRKSSSTYTDLEYIENVGGVELIIDGAWKQKHILQDRLGNDGYYFSYDGERSYQSMNLNVLFGSDFYLMKNFYLGFEVGMAMSRVFYDKIHVENSVNVRMAGIEMDDETIPSYTEKYVGLYYKSAIRLGVWL